MFRGDMQKSKQNRCGKHDSIEDVYDNTNETEISNMANPNMALTNRRGVEHLTPISST